MEVSAYLKVARATDQMKMRGDTAWVLPCLGLAGEVGSLLTELKKEVRDPEEREATKKNIAEELGDIIWYATAISRRAKLDFRRDVLFKNLIKIKNNFSDKNKSPAPLVKSMLEPGGQVANLIQRKGMNIVRTFDGYQRVAIKTSRYARSRRNQTLIPYLSRAIKNASEILSSTEGSTAKIHKDRRELVAESLGDLMWYVAGFADLYGLGLGRVATLNRKKVQSAFGPLPGERPSPFLDNDRPLLEQFPRKFSVYFVPRNNDSVVMVINGIRVGDPLEDNAYDKDGYRFHDAIHLAFVAVLGWSPVIRALMKRKRKTNKKIDAIEDGARASIVEEMIVKLAHSYAKDLDPEKLLDGQSRVKLGLLKEIELLANGLEVMRSRKGIPSRKLWEWNGAIIAGMQMFNQLRRNQRGRLDIDMHKRRISYHKTKPTAGIKFPAVAKPKKSGAIA